MWRVNPVQRTLEVLRLHEGRWSTLAVHQGEERSRAEPFDAIELELGTLWSGMPPPPTRAAEAEAE